MIITTQNILLLGSILLFISIMIGKTGIKLGIPVLLLFLIVGMGFGRDGFGIEFENPVTAQFIGVISLSIILFSGGMDTNITEIKPVIGQGITLATLGVLLTTAFTGGFVYLLASWAFPEAQAPLLGCLLLAAVMSSTDSASVFNILRSKDLNLKHNLRPLLELESGSNDPMAYMLTILLIQIIQSGEFSFGQVLLSFFILQVRLPDYRFHPLRQTLLSFYHFTHLTCIFYELQYMTHLPCLILLRESSHNGCLPVPQCALTFQPHHQSVAGHPH